MLDGASKEVKSNSAIDIGSRSNFTLRSAEHIRVFATFDVQGDIACDSSQVGTSIHRINKNGFNTAVDGCDKVDRCTATQHSLVTSAKELSDVLIARAVVGDIDFPGAFNFAINIVSSKELQDVAVVNIKAGASIADVGWSACCTIAAAKHLVETTAMDVGGYLVGCCRITTSKRTTDGIVTSEHIHRGKFCRRGRSVFWSIVGLITAAEHLADGIFRIVAGIGGRIIICGNTIRISGVAMSCLIYIHCDIVLW